MYRRQTLDITANKVLYPIFITIWTVVVPAGSMTGKSSSEGEGMRTNSVVLNGDWEFAIHQGDGHSETQEDTVVPNWQAVKLPGPFMAWNQEVVNNTRFVWVRRTFTVSDEQATNLAVLRWNQISNGAVAFINDRKVGDNAPTGPYQVILPAGVLKAGENTIVLKVIGSAAVPRAKSGSALIPSGFGPGMPRVQGDLWIDFADTAYMKWILALPDLSARKVRIRVTTAGVEGAKGVKLNAEVKSWPDGKEIGRGEATVSLKPNIDPLGGESVFVEVPMPGFKEWTYEQPNLYTAQVSLKRGPKILDSALIRFGMREITINNGDYFLNGKPLRFRGSNLVFEWDWGDTITGHEFDYLVTEAREMSLNCFRTHTMPPPPLWADICDENGTMIWAEFPCLYNYQDYKFTPAEYEIWHRHVISDAAGWMARLWNHPAVVMWVLSNESNRDGEWETGPYHDFVRGLDPTRPTMRTGDTGTAENYDVHTCGNTVDPVEGEMVAGIQSWINQGHGRPVTNSEYMNFFDRPQCQWTGNDDKIADALACAQLGMEHTEAMRRVRVDGMLPYMYAGWTRTRQAARVHETGKGSAVWKANYAAPASAVWHSSLSPILASLDIFDPDYLTGQQVTTDLYLINDSWHDASIHVDLILTDENPEFIPEAACFDQPASKWSFNYFLKADTLTKTPVTWKLPEHEGSYWLTARTTGVTGRPVLSQRFIRAIQSPQISSALRDYRFVIVGRDSAADDWFRSRGLRADHKIENLSPEFCTVVIWNTEHLDSAIRQKTDALHKFSASGGRIIVLATHGWDWNELCNIRISETRGSRAFAYPDTKHSMLTGIGSDWMMRWNGLPGTAVIGSLEGPAMDSAKKILWVREPKNCAAAEVPITGGHGVILFSLLDIQRHVDRSKPNYDPVAERILLNMLETPKSFYPLFGRK